MDQGVQIADWEIRRAQLEDIEALLHLYVEAAKWIRTSKGIVQWREEKFTRNYLETCIVENEVFVAYLASELIGGFSVHWEYEQIWGELFHTNAGYVHRLAVSRKYQAQGIGSRLLAWAETYIKNIGKAWLRLDCMADNPALNRYYRSLGFTFRGRFDGSGWSANLYEREIMN